MSIGNFEGRGVGSFNEFLGEMPFVIFAFDVILRMSGRMPLLSVNSELLGLVNRELVNLIVPVLIFSTIY